MKKIAIITARGGSKRIPRKNIKLFLGKPIIAYSIETALKSDLFDEVMVSTDDVEIAKVAKNFGAKVPFWRSCENSSDSASTIDVVLEVLNNYRTKGFTFEYACCIYPTAPFITVKMLNEAFVKLKDSDFDCVFPVLPFTYPIQRALKIYEGGKVTMFNPEYLNFRSQDLENAYHDSGQFYFFRPEKIIQAGNLFTENTAVIVLNQMQAHDIDHEDDWNTAEFKFKQQF